MQVEETAIPGVVIITPKRFGDDRGYFSESWNRQRMADHGMDIAFVQDNQSLSAASGTIRGLHLQVPPHAQDKLVRCGRGALWDVAVDLRRGSPAYGQSVGVELSAENGRQLLIPQGCAHGFATLCDNTEILYKCSAYYAPEAERAIAFDDPDLAITWPFDRSTAILSAKDAAAAPLAAQDMPFVWEGA